MFHATVYALIALALLLACAFCLIYLTGRETLRQLVALDKARMWYRRELFALADEVNVLQSQVAELRAPRPDMSAINGNPHSKT